MIHASRPGLCLAVLAVLSALPWACSSGSSATDVAADLRPDGVAADTHDVAALDAVDTRDATPPDGPTPLPAWVERPALVTRPDRKPAILARVDAPPWDDLVARIRSAAAGECVEDTHDVWDIGVQSSNGGIAQAAAALAWLFDDEAAARKARACFTHIRTDWETSTGENHSMPRFSIQFAIAWDLLAGTAFFPADEAAEARRRLVTVNEKLFDRTVLDPAVRYGSLTVTQNNITIRTSAAMAYAALVFPDLPRSREILDFAAGELDYLWGPDGRYIQEDGVVSEEPFYFGYGFPPALAFFLAMHTAWPADGWLFRTCLNRNPKDPWAPIDCTEGQPYRWEDPLAAPGSSPHADRFWGAFDWSLDHRLPSGLRSNTGDGATRTQNAGLLLAGISGQGRYAWDARTPGGSIDTGRGLELAVLHLFAIEQAPVDSQPPWTSRAHPVSGHVTLRSGWDGDARWLLLLAESGAARKTLHDHADGTSFAFAAYGEYLLIDTGYVKPNPMANSITAEATAHSVVLIDGKGAPKRGLLNNWGDADAFLDLFADGRALDYAEVRQAYEKTTLHRSALLVRDRYVVIADRLDTTATAPREHAWRVHGFAGYDSGGAYALDAGGATFERPAAGVRVGVAATDGAPDVREPPYVQDAVPHVHSVGDDGTTHHAVADAVVTAREPGFLVVLAPWKVGAAPGSPEAPLTLTRLASEGGVAAWQVQGTFGVDVVWLRDPEGPTTLALPGGEQLSTDAELVVVNLADGLLLTRGGTGVSWDGTTHTAASVAEGLGLTEPGPVR